MDSTPHPSGDPDQYAGARDAGDADPQAGPAEDPVGDTGEVTGDRLDDKHAGQDALEADEAPAAPVDEPSTPSPNTGPGGAPPV